MWTLMQLANFLSDDRQVPMAIALMLVAVLLLMSALRRRKGPATPTYTGQRPPPPSAPINDSLRRDLDDLVVELQELSRQISAQIDTRFAKLESAMRDADRRIAVLHRLARQNGALSPKPEDAAAGEDTRHVVVYELADAGFSPVEIAKDLGRTPGEVELILNLRKQAERRS